MESTAGVTGPSAQKDDVLYCELSRLNNELVNAQRELAKKNAGLAQVEVELRQEREQLEQRVEQRTKELRHILALLALEVKIRTDAELRMRELSARLLGLQDEERRRIARDLHDTTGQTLAALKMTLASLHSVVGKLAPAESLFADLDDLADQALKEIRSTSHLLHPPLLDEAGFESAAKWYVDGFSKRNQIQVELEIGALDRLPQAIEMVLFRVLQEGLTNVLRHSGATRAEVRLDAAGEENVLRIRDYGKGMSSDLVEQFSQTGGGVGVGLSGMRERARDVGGRLEVHSTESGTTITVAIPKSASSNGTIGRHMADSSRSAPAA